MPEGPEIAYRVKYDGTNFQIDAQFETAAQIKTKYESNADTNAFTDAEQTKLTGIETGATADQSDAEIKTAYENNANTNEFSDSEQTKLSGIAVGATAGATWDACGVGCRQEEMAATGLTRLQMVVARPCSSKMAKNSLSAWPLTTR